MGKRKTIEEIRSFVESNSDSVLLSTEYSRWDKPLEFECSCGNQFTATWNRFQQGQRRCNACAKKQQYDEKRLSMEDIKERLLLKNVEYVSGEYVNQDSKFTVRCSCGELFTAPFSTLTAPNNTISCRLCKHKRLSKAQKFGIDEVQAIINSYGAELISTEYNGARDKIRVRCQCGREYTTSLNNFKSGKQIRCSHCSKYESKGEFAVRTFLEDKGIQYVSQKKFADCGGKKPYPFDFYLPESNICIEYDGAQHFRQDSRFCPGVAERDAIKTKYCFDNGIQLIRIPYTVKNIPNYLDTLIPRKQLA